MAEPQPADDPFPIYRGPVNPLTNDAPVLVDPGQTLRLVENTPFRFTLKGNVFSDPDSILTYDIPGLPRWISIDVQTGTLFGTAPNRAPFDPGDMYGIEISAFDGQYTVTDTILVSIMHDDFIG